jgi:hypothetical protein
MPKTPTPSPVRARKGATPALASDEGGVNLPGQAPGKQAGAKKVARSKTEKTKIEKPRKTGMSFAWPELNALYTEVRTKVHEAMGLMYVPAEHEETLPDGRTRTVRTLDWCRTWRIEAPESAPWRLFRHDGEGWQPSPPGGFDFPAVGLLPITTGTSLEGCAHIINQSLRPMLTQCGWPFGDNQEKMIQAILESRNLKDLISPAQELHREKARARREAMGQPGYYYWDGDFVPSDYLSPEELERHALWDKESQALRSAFLVTQSILVNRIVGASPPLPPAMMAKRALSKTLWSMIDKELLGVVVTMHWRNPLSMQDWIVASQHRDSLVSIAKANRAILPLLPKIPPALWNENLLTPRGLATALWGEDRKRGIEHRAKMTKAHIADGDTPAEAEEKVSQDPVYGPGGYCHIAEWADLDAIAAQALAASVSVNAHAGKYGQETMQQSLHLNSRWAGQGLPLWIRQTLLKSIHELDLATPDTASDPFSMGFSTSSKKSPKPPLTPEWEKLWIDATITMVEFYRSTQGARCLQKRSHPFWQEVIETFNGRHHGVRFEDTSGQTLLVDALPSHHPWQPVLLKKRLDVLLASAGTAGHSVDGAGHILDPGFMGEGVGVDATPARTETPKPNRRRL